MILIASGAYVIPEFQVELGRIPPCLLPIGNKKLIEFQVNSLKEYFPNENIYLSLPESYQLSASESKIIDALTIEIIKVPDEFNLCESILYVLNTNESIHRDDTFYLLHGDTYITNFEKITKKDIISISKSNDSYNWEVVKQTDQFAMVWSGFFTFSSIPYLLKSLTLNRNNFVNAIKYYQKQYSMTNVEIFDWFDLGHSNTYFGSRANITTQRAFNDLRIHQGVVYKTGHPKIKIEAEARWFENVPAQLKKYVPVILDHGISESDYFYELEYLPYIPLNELYVHGKNELLQWNKILNKLSEYMSVSRQINIDENLKRDVNQDAYKLFADKSRDRLKQYAESQHVDLDQQYIYKNQKLPSVREIMETCIDYAQRLDVIHGVLHGDFCFSNILYDSRGDRIKVIDPRGLNYKNDFTIYGDLKYDFAKLTHSIVGFYDYIIAGYYKIEESANGSIQIVFDIDDRVLSIHNNFIHSFKLNNLTVREIMPLVILLFLSMLPLHADRPDRQKAMLINALKLYKEYI